MAEFLTHHRKKLFIVFLISVLLMVGLCAQLGFLMIARSDHYSKMADELHKRERTIKAARGEIVDRNGTVIAANRTVCTVSVIHNQVTEPEKVIRELVRILELPEPEVRKKVEKWSSREIIRPPRPCRSRIPCRRALPPSLSLHRAGLRLSPR